MTHLEINNLQNLYNEYLETDTTITRYQEPNYYNDDDEIVAVYSGNNNYTLYDSVQNEFNVVVDYGQFYDANYEDEDEEDYDECDEDEEDYDEEDEDYDECDEDECDEDEEEDDECDEDDEDDEECDEDDEEEEENEENDEEEEENEDPYYETVQMNWGIDVVYTQPAINIINQVVRENNHLDSTNILYMLCDYSSQFADLYNSELRQIAAWQIQVVSGRAYYGR